MNKKFLQTACRQWSISHGPLVVLGQYKKKERVCAITMHTKPSLTTYSTHETGPPGGSGPPGVAGPLSGSDPPNGTDPPCGTGPPINTGLLNGNDRPLKTNMAERVKDAIKPQEKLKYQFHKRKEKMRNYKPISPVGLLIAGCLCMLQSTAVFAAAGQLISNRATLNYDVGGTNTVLESSSAGNTTLGAANGADTDFVEDRVINVVVAEVGAASTSVVSSATDQVLEYTVTNNGNGTQDVLLAALNRATTTPDPFGGANDTVNIVTFNAFVEDGVTLGYQAGVDAGLFIQDLAPGASRTVYIVSDIPASLSNNETAVMTLVAQVAATSAGGTNNEDVAADAGAAIMRDDNGNVSPVGTYSNGATGPTVALGANNVADVVGTAINTDQIVFNDPAGGSVDDVDSAGTVQDIAQNGQSSDTDSYLVGAAVLTVTKTVSSPIFDPVNTTNFKAITGAFVEYTITIANAAGAGTASLTNITDALAATLAIDPDFTTDGVAAKNAVGDSFEIDTTGTGRPLPVLHYCTDSTTADADGCTDTGGAGASLTIDFTTTAALQAETTYAAGELKAGESVVIRFNVILQ